MDETNWYAAFDRIVHMHLDVVSKKKWYRKDLLLQGIENNAVGIIERMILALIPEKSKNIRRMDARVIWKTYLGLRGHSTDGGMPIFELLQELDKSPSLTSFSVE